MDLTITRSLTIPASELKWAFNRSSGPGGQHVNKTDSRVELSFDVGASKTLTTGQRQRILQQLDGKLNQGVLTVVCAQERSQWRNRQQALEKLAELIAESLKPDAPARRATNPTRGSVRRRLEHKSSRSSTKQLRRKPRLE